MIIMKDTEIAAFVILAFCNSCNVTEDLVGVQLDCLGMVAFHVYVRQDNNCFRISIISVLM